MHGAAAVVALLSLLGIRDTLMFRAVHVSPDPMLLLRVTSLP